MKSYRDLVEEAHSKDLLPEGMSPDDFLREASPWDIMTLGLAVNSLRDDLPTFSTIKEALEAQTDGHIGDVRTVHVTGGIRHIIKTPAGSWICL